MHTLPQLLAQKFGLSAEGYALLQAEMTEIHLDKGERIIREGQMQHFVYFIVTGAMRSFYVNKEGKEVNYWFGFEGDIVASLGSVIQGSPSRENIELLENCVVMKISKSRLLELFNSHLELANFGRKIAEQALLEMEEQILLTQFTDAKTRYTKLISKHPHILQRVKLGHISSYLGITQVTLSRIRAEK
jgi:CRP-like cAMP-binding protein